MLSAFNGFRIVLSQRFYALLASALFASFALLYTFNWNLVLKMSGPIS